MEANHKKILKAVMLELRRMLEGYYDGSGWHAGDLEQRLNALGVWRDRDPLPADELAGVDQADIATRKVVDAYLKLRDEAGVRREDAVAEFVRETAYTWANRLLALRCMEVRELIDEVILQKQVYGGRSLEHNRLAQRHPELCAGEDDGLFVALEEAFSKQAEHLPLLFDPKAPSVVLKPGVAALKRTIALLSGTEAVRGQEPATAGVFRAPDAFGWAYQYWNTEEKDRVFEKVRMQKGSKIEGADIIPATQLYTEPYMVKFLVHNSLGATWAGMHPETNLVTDLEYFARDVDRAPAESKPVREIKFLDPACGSGHFLLEAFDLFYVMYEEEDPTAKPDAICRDILEHNLYGIDLDERAVQISEATLWMKAAESVLQRTGSLSFSAVPANLVATNIRLPKGVDHLKTFLEKHPEDKDLSSALETVFNGLQNADELGSLLQIEGPVEAKLRDLEGLVEHAIDRGVQTHLYRPTPIQGQLPVGLRSYDDWKKRSLANLRLHFAEESEAADLAQVFFGRSAGRALKFFDLLSRKYDVVATNPPYMGNNMATLVKGYIDAHYEAGKRDLYSAFILRCVQLSIPAGRVAMVTQQSWMFLRSFADLRASGERDGDFSRGLLVCTCVETLAHIGPNGFGEISGEVVNTVLFVLANQEPTDSSRVTAFRVVAAKTAEQKAIVLRGTLQGDLAHRLRFSPRQKRFLSIPLAPLSYWLPEQVLDALEGCNLQVRTMTSEGLGTRSDSRFVRFSWEITDYNRWHQYSKGGGYGRWFGHDLWTVEWGTLGSRVKAYISENYPAEKFTLLIRHERLFGKAQLVYSTAGRGSLGVRLTDGAIPGDAGPAIFVDGLDPLQALAFFNSRASSFTLRGLTAGGINLKGFYVSLLPIHLARNAPPRTKLVASECVALKRALISVESTERTFVRPTFQQRTLAGAFVKFAAENDATAAVLHTLEGDIERSGVALYGLGEVDLQSVIEETGTPCAWFPLVRGYDATPPTRDHVTSELLIDPKRVWVDLPPDDLNALKMRIRRLYEASANDSEPVQVDDDNTESGDDEAGGQGTVGMPLPAETLIEEVAQQLQLHPISVFWLVEEMRRQSTSSTPEFRRFAEESVSILVLSILGHRWQKQEEVYEPVPKSADANGIVLLTNGAQGALLGHVRKWVSSEFEGGDYVAIEREFAETVGRSLEEWLANQFFVNHTSQFRRRPIAWQLQSGRFNARGRPAFTALLYYHKLNAQTLATIQSQYLRPLRQRYETEIRGIESVPQNARSDRQQDRLRELIELVAELRRFDEAVESVTRTAFGPEKAWPQLRQYAIDDAVLFLKSQWLNRLSVVISGGPGRTWQQKAKDTMLHDNLQQWVADAFATLCHHCSAVGSEAPKQETLKTDPTVRDLALLISKDAQNMVSDSLKLACAIWWRPLAAEVFTPLRVQIKEAKQEIKQLKREDVTKAPDPHNRRMEIEARSKSLNASVTRWQRDLDLKVSKADELREHILAWRCAEACTWEGWLASQPMYDVISSLDGVRQPPQTVAEFVSQESAYAPDINDGVRVNIAPLQKAGLLAADVLAAKDVDKAIADRAEWRADERRWCREGKLPQPGWWNTEKSHVSG